MLSKLSLAALVAFLLVSAQASFGAAILYYYDPATSLSTGTVMVSHHGVGGPVLADDFTPAASGRITLVEWWGSLAASSDWEILFNNDNAGQPNVDNPASGRLYKYVISAAGVPETIGGQTIYHYTFDLTGQASNVDVTAGVPYWITIANFADQWIWADASGGPLVGTEAYNMKRSVGSTPCLDGGPHCGAWTDVHNDAALRISGTPEPSTFLLLGGALIALAGLRLRR